MTNRKLLLIAGWLLCVMPTVADDWVDDVYYSAETALQEQLRDGTITPSYNKKTMTELVFIQDTIHETPLDTVR